MGSGPTSPDSLRARLQQGLVIPAHPLALTRAGRLDERHQRALTRYYHAAGAGGIAVGVHTTQFAIRDPRHDLFQPVLELAAETVRSCDQITGRQTVRIAGVCGLTDQAAREAIRARELGYEVGLLSLAAFPDADDAALIQHCEQIARLMPLCGFYLQPAAGGRLLSAGFWRRFVEIPEVVAIKIAPFNRYQTLDVIRAVAESGRSADIALYTGNDDTIVVDLVTPFYIGAADRALRIHITGGLLGHWACWTRRAVELLDACKSARAANVIPAWLLTLAARVTEANAALFDAAHGFAGCLPGIHHVLHGQGLLDSSRCLDPKETLSPGQAEAIDRIRRSYPFLTDDAFVQEHRDEWLAG